MTGENVSHEDLGGAAAHSVRSGVAHFAIDGEEACLSEVRRLLGFLPLNNMQDPPVADAGYDGETSDPGLAHVVPDSPNQPYNMLDVIGGVVDGGEMMQVHEKLRPETFWSASPGSAVAWSE